MQWMKDVVLHLKAVSSPLMLVECWLIFASMMSTVSVLSEYSLAQTEAMASSTIVFKESLVFPKTGSPSEQSEVAAGTASVLHGRFSTAYFSMLLNVAMAEGCVRHCFSSYISYCPCHFVSNMF